MNKNNIMYRAFKDMMEGYKEKTEEGRIKFANAVNSWMAQEPENPFEPQTPACDCFYRMQMCYTNIQRNTVGSKFSSRQILVEAEQLCELKQKNPYKFDKKADEEDKAEKAAFDAEQARLAKEAEEAAIQKEVNRIIREEQEAKDRAARQKEERMKREIERAEAQIAERERQALVAKAVEEKRAAIAEEERKVEEARLAREARIEAEYKLAKEAEAERLKAYGAVETDNSTVILNVVPEQTEENNVNNKKTEKKGFFRRIFGRKE